MIAGEESGDSLASDLMEAIKSQYPDAQFVGIGGVKMQEQGFVSWYDINRLSIIGVIEVLKNLPQLLWLRYRIIKDIIAYKPDIFIGIDAPDFNFYIEKQLKRRGIKTIHYISPSIWAWRYERIFKIKQSTDVLLCLFPFETEMYHEQGIKSYFIGHPLASKVEYAPDTLAYRKQFLEYAEDSLVVTILCGSRKHEITMLAPEAIKSANIVSKNLPDSQKLIVLFPVSQKMAPILELELKKIPVEFIYKIIINNTLSAIKACDISLVKSGTVSLEVALCKKPMVVFYKLQPLSAYFIAKRITIKFVGLANIIASKIGLIPVVPELIQDAANATNIADTILSIYNDKILQQEMMTQFQKIHEALQRPVNYKNIINQAIMVTSEINRQNIL